MRKLYREKFQIYRDVLSACEGGDKISKVAQKAHLTTSKAHEHIDFLIERNLIQHGITKEPRTQKAKKDIDVYDTYTTTPSGLQVRLLLDKLLENLLDD